MPRHVLEGWFETVSGHWVAQCCCGWVYIGQDDATEVAWQAHWREVSRGK